MVGSRIRCLNTTSMRKIISKYSANQVWPSLKLFSTKTRERSGSAKLGLEEALGLFNSLVLTKPRPPVSKFDKVLEAISSSHQGSFNIRAAVVIALLKVMTSLEIRPSVVTLNMLMECYCCGVGRLDLGFSVLARIFRLGLAPNGATWTRLLTGLVAHGCGNQLRRGIVGRNLIIGVVFDNIKDGVHNNNSVRLKDLVDPRWTNLADRLLSRTCGYTCLLRGFASSGSEDEVNAVFNQLITTYYFPDSCSVYTAFHHALCQQGLITVVHALLQLMIFDNKLCLAHKSLDRMIKNGHTPAPPTFQLLIDAFHEESRTDKAHAISSLYLATHAHPPTPPPSLTRLYNWIVATLCKEDDMWDQTAEVIKDMIKAKMKLDHSNFSTLLEKCHARDAKTNGLGELLFGKIERGFLPKYEFWAKIHPVIENHAAFRLNCEIEFLKIDRNNCLPP